MSDLNVRVVTLEPMRVASAHAYGPSPEGPAWDKLIAWAGAKGLLEDPAVHRIFGFNNPNPSPGTPNYGYEFWIQVGPEVEGEGEITIKEFAGGLYAVSRCECLARIGQDWQALAAWAQESPYTHGKHQWLEKHISPAPSLPQSESELVLDLYLPIAQ
jgi:DNA gyrase inhibitor GyrI